MDSRQARSRSTRPIVGMTTETGSASLISGPGRRWRWVFRTALHRRNDRRARPLAVYPMDHPRLQVHDQDPPVRASLRVAVPGLEVVILGAANGMHATRPAQEARPGEDRVRRER